MDFENKVLLITGGTGSFGKTVLKRFLATNIAEIRIFSRDEKKQDDLRKRLNNPRLKFFLGDVRDKQSIDFAMNGANFVFHAAALKQVPSCEFFPLEAVKTNVLGTENVIQSAIENSIEKIICLSTDKAVYPVNAMGMTKALMEKLLISKSKIAAASGTTICGTRYGNVLASRGSVVPLMVSQILEGKPLTVTEPKMTRFVMTLEDAVELVLYAFEYGKPGEIFVHEAPATTIGNLAQALKRIFGVENHPVSIIGVRHGERMFETLLSREEMLKSDYSSGYFCMKPDQRDLNYENFVSIGEKALSQFSDFDSNNARQLSEQELDLLLTNLDVIKDARKF